MKKSGESFYQSRIYPEKVLDRAIQDYKRIALIHKEKIEDGFKLSFSTRYRVEVVIREFGNYLIQIMNRGQV